MLWVVNQNFEVEKWPTRLRVNWTYNLSSDCVFCLWLVLGRNWKKEEVYNIVHCQLRTRFQLQFQLISFDRRKKRAKIYQHFFRLTWTRSFSSILLNLSDLRIKMKSNWTFYLDDREKWEINSSTFRLGLSMIFNFLDWNGSQGILEFSSSFQRIKGKFLNRKFWTHKRARMGERNFQALNFESQTNFLLLKHHWKKKSKEKLEKLFVHEKMLMESRIFNKCFYYVGITCSYLRRLKDFESFFQYRTSLAHACNRYLLNVEDIF